MSSSLGWQNLKAVHSQVVRKSLKSTCKCKVCGMDLYYLTICLKRGPVLIAYENGFHGSEYQKVLYNHEHMIQARLSCLYCKPGHDVVTGLKIMTAEEEAKLREEYESMLSGVKRTDIAEVHREVFIERALAIQEELRKAGKIT